MGKLIEIEGRYYKECNIVMLPTKDKSVLSKAYLANPSYLRYNIEGYKYDSYQNNDNQHLYITNDEKPKKGDWCFHRNSNSILQFDLDEKAGKKYEKVISATDKSLMHLSNNGRIGYNLPQPPQSFIEAFVKTGGIDKALVEYEKEINYMADYDEDTYKPIFKIKTDSHNTITIKSIKEKMYSKEKVKNHVYNALGHFAHQHDIYIDGREITKWIKENL